MIVQVRLYAAFRRYFPDLPVGTAKEIELADNASLSDLFGKLGLPETEVKVAFVNGLSRRPDWVLQERDEVGIFPTIGGG